MSTTLDSAVANDFEVQCAIVIKALKGSSSDGRAKALRAAQLVVREIQTPVELSGNQTWAPVELAAAGAACEMDIFSALASTGSPMTVSDIAKSAKGGDELLIQRIVQGLAAHGMVTQVDEEHYHANDVTKEYATPGRAAAVMTQLFSTRAYASLPWFLRETNYKMPTDLKNCAWQYAYGTQQTIWEWLKANPEMGGYFNKFMAAGRADSGEDLKDIFSFERLFEGASKEDVLFVDVGGGFGQQCLNLRQTFPRERGRVILQDLPYVVEGKQLEDVEVMGHDMMEEQPVKGAKVYYFRGVLHDHDDEVCRKFLKQIVKVMGPESRLLVHDVIIEDFMPTQKSTRQDLGLMCLFAGRERTKGQMKQLLESVGLKVLETYKTGPEKWSITEARL